MTSSKDKQIKEKVIKNRTEYIRIAKFLITGGLNTIVDWGMFTLAFSFFGLSKYIAQIIGYSCGTLNSYAVNRSWTFRSKNRFFSLEMVKFIILNITVLLLSLGVMRVGIYIFEIPFFDSLVTEIKARELLIKIFVVTPFTLTVNFIGSRILVFRDTN